MFLTNKLIILVFRRLSTLFFRFLKNFPGAVWPAPGEGKRRYAASRSADVKYFRSGLYSRANTTRHRTMLGSM